MRKHLVNSNLTHLMRKYFDNSNITHLIIASNLTIHTYLLFVWCWYIIRLCQILQGQPVSKSKLTCKTNISETTTHDTTIFNYISSNPPGVLKGIPGTIREKLLIPCFFSTSSICQLNNLVLKPLFKFYVRALKILKLCFVLIAHMKKHLILQGWHVQDLKK